MRLVDHRTAHRRGWRLITFPVEARVDHDAARRPQRRRGARLQILLFAAQLVGEAAAVPVLDAVQAARVRIEHDDVGIETMPARGVVGTVNAVTIALPYR